MNERTRGQVDELDLLRGLAIVLMIANHAGVRLLPPESYGHGPAGAVAFLGSFAPVVFFFTTGFGIGVRTRRVDLAAFADVLFKASLLVLADQFLFWKDGTALGLDFLGFIGLSTVFVTAVSMTRRPVALASALAALILVLRFAVGPGLRDSIELSAPIAWLLGVKPIEHVSYPFAPWMVYPLMGFVAARRYAAASTTASSGSMAWRATAGITIAALGMSAVLSLRHASFFRWGQVSAGFFILSIGVLGVSCALAWWLCPRSASARRMLSLRGTASLAVVPIHYALIALVVAAGARQVGDAAYLLAAAALTAAAIGLSKFFAQHATRWMSAPDALFPTLMSALVVLCVAAEWLWWGHPVAPFAAFVVAQLAIAALITRRGPRTAPSRVEVILR